MKYAALSKGAELAPISGTLGMESGRGVVSRRTFWLNLWGVLECSAMGQREIGYLGWRAAIIIMVVVEVGWVEDLGLGGG